MGLIFIPRFTFRSREAWHESPEKSTATATVKSQVDKYLNFQLLTHSHSKSSEKQYCCGAWIPTACGG